MRDQRRLLALSTFHFVLVAAALTPPFWTFATPSIHPTVGVAMLAYLAVVAWRVTRRARASLPADPRSRIDAYVTVFIGRGGFGFTGSRVIPYGP